MPSRACARLSGGDMEGLGQRRHEPETGGVVLGGHSALDGAARRARRAPQLDIGQVCDSPS